MKVLLYYNVEIISCSLATADTVAIKVAVLSLIKSERFFYWYLNLFSQRLQPPLSSWLMVECTNPVFFCIANGILKKIIMITIIF
jgi:uncharacterized protein YfaT (DUF1175 family)